MLDALLSQFLSHLSGDEDVTFDLLIPDGFLSHLSGDEAHR